MCDIESLRLFLFVLYNLDVVRRGAYKNTLYTLHTESVWWTGDDDDAAHIRVYRVDVVVVVVVSTVILCRFHYGAHYYRMAYPRVSVSRAPI